MPTPRPIFAPLDSPDDDADDTNDDRPCSGFDALDLSGNALDAPSVGLPATKGPLLVGVELGVICAALSRTSLSASRHQTGTPSPHNNRGRLKTRLFHFPAIPDRTVSARIDISQSLILSYFGGARMTVGTFGIAARTSECG
jgi:hypothetical protein